MINDLLTIRQIADRLYELQKLPTQELRSELLALTLRLYRQALDNKH